MINTGFRGTVVLVERLTIAASQGGPPTIQASVQFAAEDGTVHAVAHHSFLVDPEAPGDELVPALRELIQAVTRRIETIHFSEPRESEQRVLLGIAETLRAASSATDEPGTQG